MLNRIFKNDKKVDMDALLKRVESIRKCSDTIALYGAPTGSNWLGIANASRAIFGETALEIPQEYSRALLSEKQIQLLSDAIITNDFNRVILSGFADYFFQFAEKLRQKIEVDALFHGTLSECHSTGLQEMVGKLIAFAQEKKLTRLAFVRVGLAEVFSQMYAIECYHQPVPVDVSTFVKTDLSLDKNYAHIGVFGGDTFNKNLHNQVLGALLVKDSVVHVQDAAPFLYLGFPGRIIAHGKNLSRNEFLNLLANMDLNLYLSFSESWGLVAAESAALGVPCIISRGSSLSGVQLHSLDEIDSPEKIAKTIHTLLNK